MGILNLTKSQLSDIKELLNWVHACLAAGFLSYRPSLSGTLCDLGLDLQDVLYALETCRDVTADYAPGTFTLHGRNVDGLAMAVVIAERSEKNRIKVLTVWRE